MENVLDTCKKLDLTSFKDNVPEHIVDLHAACPRCLAVEASKPGANDGESSISNDFTLILIDCVMLSIEASY